MTAIIAHRGASSAATENTLEALVLAVEMGADWLELDVRRTADDVLVLHHDAHLADGRVIVELGYDALPAYVPTLAEALEAGEGARVNIEIKNDPDDPDYDARHQISDAVVGLALAYRQPDDLLISSFNIDAIRRIIAVEPSLPTALVTGTQIMDPAMLVDRLVGAGIAALHPWEHALDAGIIARAHDAGLRVNTWTVNTAGRMREVVALGVDGIITDVPDLAVATLR